MSAMIQEGTVATCVVIGARRNLDAIDSHLGRLLQGARHHEPPVLIGFDLLDVSSACRGWQLLPGVALDLVSMAGIRRHQSAYSVPWGKRSLTSRQCSFAQPTIDTDMAFDTVGPWTRKGNVVRGARASPSEQGRRGAARPKTMDVGIPLSLSSGEPPASLSPHTYWVLPRVRTQGSGSQSCVMDETRGSWLKCNPPPRCNPPSHQRCDGISHTYPWTGRLRYPVVCPQSRPSIIPAPIFGGGKGPGEAHFLGAEPAVFPATEQTRNGDTWPRSTRPGAIAEDRWPHGRSLPPSWSWSPTTFGLPDVPSRAAGHVGTRIHNIAQ